MRHVGHVESASPAPGLACDRTKQIPCSVQPWKQMFHPRCHFVLPTPSWHTRLEFLRLSLVWSLPIQQGHSKTVDSIPARRPRNGQPTLLRANNWSQDVPPIVTPAALPLWSVLRESSVRNLPSLPSGLAHESVLHCAARDLPTREAMKRGVDLQDVAQTLPDALIMRFREFSCAGWIHGSELVVGTS